MNKLIWMQVFYGKKRKIYQGFLGLVFLVIIFIGYVDEPTYIQILDKAYYQNYFNTSIKTFLPMIFSIGTLMLLIDHDEKVNQIIIAYQSRLYVYLHKFITYAFIMTLWMIITWGFLHIFMSIFTQYYILNFEIIGLFFHLWCDNIILMILFLIFIKNSHINRGLIIIFIYLIYPMLIESIHHPFDFYLFPIFTIDMGYHFLVYAYKICYSCIGILLGSAFHEKMQIY